VQIRGSKVSGQNKAVIPRIGRFRTSCFRKSAGSHREWKWKKFMNFAERSEKKKNK